MTRTGQTCGREERVGREEQRAREAGRAVRLGFLHLLLLFPPWSRFLLICLSCHSQLYLMYSIRAEMNDPKQVNTLLVVFRDIEMAFLL